MNKNTTSESASPFFRKALEEHTDALMTALIDGLVNTRYAQQEDMWLKENGHDILLRLMEIYCHICHPEPGSIVQGWDLDVLERLLSRILAMELNMDGRKRPPQQQIAKSSRPSVLESLRKTPPQRTGEKKEKHHEEVR